MQTCALLAVGDELLDGRVSDTNSDFIIERLTPLGFEVVLRVNVGDDLARIGHAISLCMGLADVVVVTGGLGPTGDDLTREAVAGSLRRPLHRDGRLEERLRGFFETMGRKMSDTNLKQADLVEGAVPIDARLGTAPGQWIEAGGKLIFLVPGVPREMRDMIEGDVIPLLARRFALEERGMNSTFLVAAMPESELAEHVEKALSGVEGVRAAYRAMLGQIEVKLSAPHGHPGFRGAEERVKAALGAWVVAEGGETLQGNLGEAMRGRGLTLAVAESLTGGMVGERITSVPGSSDYFLGSIVAYTYDAKAGLLGVNAGLLRERGAVNEEVAKAMARGARQRFSSHLGIALSGVAGPDGGEEDEPPGTVAFGLADETGTYGWIYRLPGDREMVRQFATTIMLTITLLYVRGEDYSHVR
ncbi:MAG: CinA family nicotinamide mononucleotide deamidase-related protein [Actinomycetota bacterium]